MQNELPSTIASGDIGTPLNRVPYLRRKASSIFDSAMRLDQTLHDECVQAYSAAEIMVRLELIEQMQATFNLTHNSLEELDYDEIGSELRDKFDELILSLKSRLRVQLERRQLRAPPSSTMRPDDSFGQSSSASERIRQIRLPELKLPTFSGGYTEYADFVSVFRTLVDEDSRLEPIEKFQHLRSCLSGCALEAIRSLEVSSSNYPVALEILRRRFSNKKLVFQAHVMEILALRLVDPASATTLRAFADKVNAHMRALQSLGSLEQIAGCMVVQILLQRLDRATQSDWEERSAIDQVPTTDGFLNFLDTRCQRLESVQHAMAALSAGSPSKSSRKALVVTQGNPHVCTCCEADGHGIYSCPRFLDMTASQRYNEACRLGRCINCLKFGHTARRCNAGHCRKCKERHHTLLHNDGSQDQVSISSQPDAAPSVPQQYRALAAQSIQPTTVLLATAVVLVRDRHGSLVPCRVLLDSGSQLHMVTSRFAHALRLKRSHSGTTVAGLGDSPVTTDGSTVRICLQSRVSQYSTTFTALVAPAITDCQPSYKLNTSAWNIPVNITLADPDFYIPHRIDILIGASLFYELLCIGQIHLASGLPLLQKTLLGWVVSGGGEKTAGSTLLATRDQEENTSAALGGRLDELVRRFWEIDSCEATSSRLSKEEMECEEHFCKTHTRLSSGAYVVSLPMDLTAYPLGESYTQACRRFLTLERKLQRNPLLNEQYSSFMSEYLQLNHMTLVSPEDLSRCKYFLPHHCVLKEDSSTTKLRVVFDGSAATSSGHSLNDAMLSGPIIQPRLLHILLRFRSYQVALTGDICKMYRCVQVSNSDSYYQCILWRNSPEQDLQVFKLDTVTYGTKAASFLSVRAMHQLSVDERESFPIGSTSLREDFYVDDFISGAESVEKAVEKMQQTTSILAQGCFKLRKWSSSHPEVLEGILDEDKESFLKFKDGSDITKTLGLAWDPTSDVLLFSLTALEAGSKPCRRSVLATIARFYDPLGLLGPTITKAKIFLQHLCKDKLHWDESLSLAHSTTWRELCDGFQSIQSIAFPRVVLRQNEELELHGFCDASESAYGACIYVVSKGTAPMSNLLCSKSRVAPLKTQSIPRLELCGALLLSKLMAEIRELGIFAAKYYCWCDSSVALSWIRDEPYKLNVFVANRVTSIQELTDGMEWHHVPTSLNPADILSRGSLPQDLAQSGLWFHGPTYLVEGQSVWPPRLYPEESTQELRKRICLLISPHADLTLGCKHLHNFASMQRTFAYVYRFRYRIFRPSLNVSDIHHGTLLLCRIVQLSNLWDDIKALRSDGVVRKSSSLSSLLPFIDDNGVLRVGGRLANSSLPFESRHPIILPRKHPITTAIIEHIHRTNLHIGPRALLAKVRLQYWPIGGLRTVSRIVRTCIMCFRAKPRTLEPIMANLPKERLEAVRAFSVCGVDYCGPFLYKSEVRTRAPLKSYVSVFICFTSKAVHLELVKDLTTGAFLSALKRFVALRGTPSQIWSDNATNFVGARNELMDLRKLLLSNAHMKDLHQSCLDQGIDWKFIPPRSPHFGGLWEAAVKSAKYHLVRSIGSAVLAFDELRTLICQIAGVINSRPLLSISESPDDLDVLTPAHLLMGGPATLLIEPDLTRLNFNRLDGWQRVTQLQQQFWSRWTEEYLTQLQQRTKWRVPDRRLKVNDVVLIKDEGLPPLRWPLARVVSLIPGKDGDCRVAELKTSTGTTKRAIAKLCLLPSNDLVEREASNGGSMSGAA